MIVLNVSGDFKISSEYQFYRSNERIEAGEFTNLLSACWNYYRNFLRILADIHAGARIDQVICMSQPSVVGSTDLPIGGLIYTKYTYAYPGCLLPDYTYFRTTIPTGFMLSTLGQTDFLTQIDTFRGDFIDRFGAAEGFDRFIWFNWCMNRKVQICQG